MNEKIVKTLEMQEQDMPIKEIAKVLDTNDKVLRNLLRRNGYRADENGKYIKVNDANKSNDVNVKDSNNNNTQVSVKSNTRTSKDTLNPNIIKYINNNFDILKRLIENSKDNTKIEHKQPHYYNNCVSVSLKINKDVYERFCVFCEKEDGLGKKDWLSYLVEIGLDKMD